MEGLIAGTTAVNAIFFDFGVHTFENTPVGRHGDLGISWINLSIPHGFEDSSRFQCRDEEADSEESDFEEQACDGQWVPACSQPLSLAQLFGLAFFAVFDKGHTCSILLVGTALHLLPCDCLNLAVGSSMEKTGRRSGGRLLRVDEQYTQELTRNYSNYRIW